MNFQIIENPSYENFNKNLLHDFWSFSDTSRLEFRYTVKQLIIKYNFKTYIKLHTIVKNSGYVLWTKSKKCGKCNETFKTFLRDDLASYRYNILNGSDCKSCKNEKKVSEVLTVIGQIKEKLTNINSNEYKYHSIQKPLSYLEKIIIYVLINQNKNSSIIKNEDWEFLINYEEKGIDSVIKNLSLKGYLFEVNKSSHLIRLQSELKALSYIHNRILNERIKLDIHDVLENNICAGIKLILPDDCEDLDGWSKKILIEIQNSTLQIEDLKEIENYIISKRLQEIYTLIDFISNQKHIAVNKNNALRVNLVKMAELFSLQHIYSFLSYQADLTIDHLCELEKFGKVHRKIKEAIFSNKIGSFLDRLERLGEQPKLAFNLPDSWIYSQVEEFLNINILKNEYKWEKLKLSLKSKHVFFSELV